MSHIDRRWLQFSLRTALVLILVAAVAVSMWTSNERAKENERLQAENVRLRTRMRNELGELEIKDVDRDKLHAIAIPSIEPMTWKWRVYIPTGRQFWINFITQGVSDSNHPTNGSGSTIQPGEQIMTVALRKNEAAQDQWQWVIQCGGATVGPNLEGKSAQWIQRKSHATWNSTARKEHVMVEPGKPLEMFRYRSFPTEVQSMTGVGDGILVWIRESKPKE